MLTKRELGFLAGGFMWSLKELQWHDLALESNVWIETMLIRPVPNPIPSVLARFDDFCYENRLTKEEKEQFRQRVFLQETPS